MNKGSWVAKKIAKIVLIVAVALVVFGFIVMSLWNAILPAVLHVSTITFGQALGILVLCKLLFGGFKGGWGGQGHGPARWRNMEKLKEKWTNMTPEEREKFKQRFRNGRCRSWGDMRREHPWSDMRREQSGQTNPSQE